VLSAGAKAPGFTLADLSGKRHALGEILERGPVLLALYKIGCPTCQLTLPYLERIANASEKNAGRLQVIGISQDDERGTQRFLKTHSLTMPMLLDREEDGYQASNAYGITHVPSLFLVETDGTISLATSGFAKPDLEAIGRRAGVEPFHAEDHVPEWKAG
jgi:peroxiredoxin